jgi:acyl carrier protein
MSDSIQNRVLKVIATTRRLPVESVTPDSTFEELGVDSLDRLNILFDLEGEFDIEIDDEEAKKVTSLRQMIDGVTHLVDTKSAEAEGMPTRFSEAVTSPRRPAGEPEPPLDPAVLPAPFHDPSETED